MCVRLKLTHDMRALEKRAPETYGAHHPCISMVGRCVFLTKRRRIRGGGVDSPPQCQESRQGRHEKWVGVAPPHIYVPNMSFIGAIREINVGCVTTVDPIYIRRVPCYTE